MNADTTADGRIALQPESGREENFLNRFEEALSSLGPRDAALPHFSGAVPDYPDLDHTLHERAQAGREERSEAVRQPGYWALVLSYK